MTDQGCQITIVTPELELGFSRESGALTMLRRPGDASVLGYSDTVTAVDVRLDGRWLRDEQLGSGFFPRYLSHRSWTEGSAALVTVRIGMGPLLVRDHYRITGTLISRTLWVRNVGLDEQAIDGLLLLLPGCRIGGPDDCTVEAPANLLPPRLALETAAERFREARLERSPGRGPGLLGMHGTTMDFGPLSLLCWYYSQQLSAQPQVQHALDTDALSLGHELRTEVTLGSDEELQIGTQYVLLVNDRWHGALEAFQRTLQLTGATPPDNIPRWLSDGAIYETHPGLFGGFDGLMHALPMLRRLGITVLQLLPIWPFPNADGQPWTGTWSGSSHPYAVLDYERIDPSLGDLDDLRALVAYAHELGMHVLVDLPLHGCSRQSHYVETRPHWLRRDERGRPLAAEGVSGVYAFDVSNADFREHIVRWTAQLAGRVAIDGYRVLYQSQRHHEFNNQPAAGMIALMRQLRRELKQLRPDLALISDLPGPLATTCTDATVMVLPHLMLYRAGLGQLSSFELGEWLEDVALVQPSGWLRICFAEFHRTQYFNPLADAARGSRLSRLILAAVIACGYLPLLWHGQEHSQERFITRLLGLRRTNPVLRDGSTTFNLVPSDMPEVFTVLRQLGGETVLGIFNLGPQQCTATLSLPVDRLWLSAEIYHIYDLLAGQPITSPRRQYWQREDLLRLSLTVEPYSPLLVELRPGKVPTTPARRVPSALRRPHRRRRAPALRRRAPQGDHHG